jgi:hypothetical protein
MGKKEIQAGNPRPKPQTLSPVLLLTEKKEKFWRPIEGLPHSNATKRLPRPE